ncbi:gypsy retrotransposon integrase 1 [Plakobranchus ocellatus]|uniref:Gypsy retrotransposon integrase 1 n=1 Tax=Plakobranchus ocellatus TaxID=259542 RepID=A0AAV3YXN7_9GAST|nr:gypsy retrotransposon integrase 1 [Plakobranchus ocellatus]
MLRKIDGAIGLGHRKVLTGEIILPRVTGHPVLRVTLVQVEVVLLILCPEIGSDLVLIPGMLARVSSLDLIRAVVLVWPRVVITSHTISMVAMDMCGVSAQVVQRKLILLVRFISCIPGFINCLRRYSGPGIEPSVNNESSSSDTPTHFDVLAPFSDLSVRQWEDPSLAPWFKRIGLPPVAGVSFQIEDGVPKRLHAKSEFARVQTTIAVPESLRQLMLSYVHESDLVGHSGFRKTLSAIRTQFSWPGVCSDVKNYTTSCHLCQIKPRTGRDRPTPFQPVTIVGGPFERVMIDLVGPLPLSSDRYEYLLTHVDVSTRWAEAVPLRRITA